MFSVAAMSSTATVGAIITFTAALNSRFRPSVDQYRKILVTDNSINVDGYLKVTTAGVVTIGVGTALGTFTASNNAGFLGFTVPWILA